MAYTSVLALILLAICLCQSAPINSDGYTGQIYAINSAIDISGQPVRQKRAYEQDYFICYPSSVVYGYHANSNALDAHRRSDVGVSAYDSFQARKDRADRERAEYTDSFGK